MTASLIWATPDGDKIIAYLARVSNSAATPDDPSARLIGYLLRNHHWSPFEMASMCVEIHTTRDISAQILRHRSFSFQEFSTRYAEVETILASKECRFQDTANRQNSLDARPDDRDTVEWWHTIVRDQANNTHELYAEALRRGVAKEVARSILPMGLTPTRIYMSGTVRSWIHYLSERTKPGVQREHREVALAVEAVFVEAFPLVAQALVANNG